MSISKILKRVAEKKLGEIDFERINIKAPGIWMYRRSAGNKIQEIWIQKAQHRKGIEFLLDYMFYVHDIVDITRVFTPKLVHMIRQSVTHFIEYENENELECIVTEFTDVIIKEVLPIYEIIIRPSQYPSKELERELYENVQMYANRCVEQYNLSYETEVVNIKKSVKKLEELVDEHRNLTGKDLDEFLLCLAGYYGELIRRAHKGKQRKQEEDQFYILEIKKTKFDRPSLLSHIPISPLGAIFAYWDKPEVYSNKITANYNHLLWGIELHEIYE